ncbi:MAG: tetratricopeptide repeat protein [Ignavibacteria bacterium]|nr:tetratricopeptide repeat protein [Ignavibacteria bacterium]
MRKIIILITLLYFGCSSKEVIKEEQKENLLPKKSEAIVTIKNLEAKRHFIQGLTYSLQEQPEKAIIEFQEALIFEDNPNIHFALAIQLYKIKKFELAVKYLEKVLALPDTSLQPDFLLVAAQVYLMKGDFSKARDQLERLVKIDSSNIDALYNLAQMIEPKDKERAKSYYEKILTIQSDNKIAMEALLNYYYENKNYLKCEELIKNMIFNDPYDVELRFRLVGLYREWGKEDLAKNYLKEIDERFPDEIMTKLYLIEISLDEKKYDEAIIQLKTVISLNSQNEDGRTLVYDYVTSQAIKDSAFNKLLENYFAEQVDKNDTSALVYLFLTKVNSGLEKDLDELFPKLVLSEQTLETLKKFGGQFYIDGKYAQSIYVLRKIYDYYENDFDVNVTLGQAYFMEGDFRNTVNFLEKSAEINSSNPELLNVLSYSLGKLKRYDEAIKYSEKALAIDNKNKNSFINLGLLFDDAEYFDRCDSIYEEALKIYPDDPTLLNNYAYSLAKRKVNLEKALAMSKKSLEKDSLVDSYLDTLGWIYFQMGKLQEAEHYIKLAIEQGSPSAEILEHMGDVYAKMNKKDEAMEYYKLALKMDPTNEKLKLKLEEIK